MGPDFDDDWLQHSGSEEEVCLLSADILIVISVLISLLISLSMPVLTPSGSANVGGRHP